MKKQMALIMILAMLCGLCTAAPAEEGTLTLLWEHEAVKYDHFTDLGSYVLLMDDADYADWERGNAEIGRTHSLLPGGCTATVRKNDLGEVIIGRNMDVEISQMPAYICRIKGAPYEALTLTYLGIADKYRYDELDELDADEDYVAAIPYLSTDAFNEKGLYAEINMRETDPERDMYCSGTHPGAETRACMLEAAALVALNAATVEEALAYLDSVDWYTMNFCGDYEGTEYEMLWNLALIIADAQGNWGLVEFAGNGIYYTPYVNGQANYYIHPEIAEYAAYGSGYGRFAAALRGLPACQTEEDMLHNMESCMWKKELLEPGIMGYSDYEESLYARRRLSREELHAELEEYIAPMQDAAAAFYAGDEEALRETGLVWTTSFNIGVNCARKHLILRLFEREDMAVDFQW